MNQRMTPIRDLNRRMPEQGRIRLGTQVANKSGKGTHPEKLAHFRFTSADKDAIHELAEKYGGTPVPWTDAPSPGQWELYSTTDEIPVVLPANPLGDGIQYEMWNKGGIMRRCDGVECEVDGTGPDGPEKQVVPCICNSQARGDRCKGKLRLNVVLHDIKFGGSWRLETSSDNALREMPGMIDMILSLQESGLTMALLRLEQRVKYERGTKKEFAVPVLGVADSMTGIIEGRTALGAYTQAPAGALGPSTKDNMEPIDGETSDNEPADAEILVGERVLGALADEAMVITGAWNKDHPEGPISDRQLLQLFAAQLTGHPMQRLADLNEAQGDRLLQLLASITNGGAQFMGIEDGIAKVKKL